MGFVNLPSVDDIQQQKDPKQQMEMLINTLGLLMKELGEINGYLGGSNIRAKSIQAEKIDVGELSAISANLGHITAGLIEAVNIYGSYIATSQSYPRIEFSSGDNLLRALRDINNHLSIQPSYTGAPTVVFVGNGFGSGTISGSSLGFDFVSSTKLRLIAAGGDLELEPGAYFINVPNWGRVKNKTSGLTLQQELDNLSATLTASINSKINETVAKALMATNMAFDTGTRNLKLYNWFGDTIATVNIPK